MHTIVGRLWGRFGTGLPAISTGIHENADPDHVRSAHVGMNSEKFGWTR
jgi:hypothetical protein